MPVDDHPTRLHLWATEALANASKTLAAGREWRRAIDEEGAESGPATNAAYLMGASLAPILENRGAPLHPLESKQLRSEHPDLAARINEFLDAAETARDIARGGSQNSVCPRSWAWFDQLEEAYTNLSAEVQRRAELTDCDRACLEVIDQAGRRLKRGEVVKALEEAGELHGQSTIKNSLAKLVRAKLLTNNRGRGAKGYGRPEWQE
jgi:hypothetical protein